MYVKEPLHVYNNNIIMSSIIDQDVFSFFTSEDDNSYDNQALSFAQSLSRKISQEQPIKIIGSNTAYQVASRLHLPGKDYLLKISVERGGNGLFVTACRIEGIGFRRMGSQNQRETMREVLSLQFSGDGEGILYSRQGRLLISLKLTLPSVLPRSRSLIDIYNRIIYKNIYRLHTFLIKKDRHPETDQHNISQYNEELTLTRLMHTQTNFDFAEERSQFRQGQAALKQQRLQLRIILENITIENTLERVVDSLFYIGRREIRSEWIKDNLNHISDSLLRKYKNSLQVPWIGQRRIDDFVFNTVDIQLRGRMAKPCAEGGSSYIFLAKGLMSFVNSLGYEAYRRPEEKIQKTFAVKALKPGLTGTLRERLEHERRIIARMHGGCCYFLPKYYGTAQESELSQYLLMEFVNGEPLDVFLKQRKATVSLRTKLFLLLNIVHGMRFLISREIVHLDLKPSNVLIDKKLIPKIIDFGSAYHRELCPKHYLPGFTFPYVAPEVYIQYQNQLHQREGEEVSYSEKQDIFAFGMIMHEVLFGSPLFSFDLRAYRQIYIQKDITKRIFLCAERSESIGESFMMAILTYVIGQCLHPLPELRPKFDWIGVLLKLLLNSSKNH